mgnify:CR=1 FL=1
MTCRFQSCQALFPLRLIELLKTSRETSLRSVLDAVLDLRSRAPNTLCQKWAFLVPRLVIVSMCLPSSCNFSWCATSARCHAQGAAAASSAVMRFGEEEDGRVVGCFIDRTVGKRPTVVVTTEGSVTNYNPQTGTPFALAWWPDPPYCSLSACSSAYGARVFTGDVRVQVTPPAGRIVSCVSAAGTMLGNIVVVGTTAGQTIVLDAQELR